MRPLLPLLLLLTLAACLPLTPTPGPEAYYTQAAQTLRAQGTLDSIHTALALLTQLAYTPTPKKATRTPRPTHTVTLAPEKGPSPTFTPSSTPAPCDAGAYISDLDIPPNTGFTTGESFVKAWRIRNTGDCLWTTAYILVFADGDQLNAPTVVGLSRAVSPGEAIDITVPMTAPAAPGDYAGRWELRSPDGLVVQLQDAEQASLWVRIRVSAPPPITILYDFVESACQARWRSRLGDLLCPGTTSDSQGSVIPRDRPNTEAGRISTPALYLRPDASAEGWISGEYSFYHIEPGDHFLARVGCLSGSERCHLLFRLDYRTPSGALWNLGTWEERYDGDLSRIDVNLSPLEGQAVQFILGVSNQGPASDADGLWLNPRIEGPAKDAELVLTWHREGGPRSLCQDLKIYLTGRTSAEARAASCKGSGQNFGRMALSSSELATLLKYLDSLAPFDGETFTPASGEPVIAVIVLQGFGAAVAGDSDISALQTFAERLYHDMSS